jgi:hypothetical protein
VVIDTAIRELDAQKDKEKEKGGGRSELRTTEQPDKPARGVSRRDFLKHSSLATAAAAAAVSFPHVLQAQNKQAINAVIIGIGGRGGGAGPSRWWSPAARR